MLLARRALSLTLGFLILVGLWYINRRGYLHHLPPSFDHWKSNAIPGPISHSQNSSLTSPHGLSPNITFNAHEPTTEPNTKRPTDKTKKPNNFPPAHRFTNGQQVFGTRVFRKKHPVDKLAKFNHGFPLELPKCQADFKSEDESDTEKRSREDKLEAVKKSFEHSWKGYKEKAWMKDELSPVDGKSTEAFGGWAATLVDTLDTLWIMGMKQEFEEAVEAAAEIDFFDTNESNVNLFETTIRYLGGFLGAYDISQGNYPVLLRKATEVGDLVYCAFDTPNHMPATRFNWRQVLAGEEQQASSYTSIAEIGSLSLEMTRLSQLTGDMKYFDAIQRIYDHLEEAQMKTSIPGLWPTIMDAHDITFNDNGYTLGAMADSAYEYLPKMYMLLGGRGEQVQRMYESAIVAAMNHIFFQPMVPDNHDLLISGSASANHGSTIPTTYADGQHLSCYAGGMVGIGAKIFEHPEHMNMARKLVDGCIWAYDVMPAGIMPESFSMLACEMNSECEWDEWKWRSAVLDHASRPEELNLTDNQLVDYLIKERKVLPGFTNIHDPRYLLRPEAIESVFIHYRLTGERDLLDAAWRMFEAVEKHTRTEYANAQIDDVTIEQPEKENKMESFWMAETLKYFYLIFADPSVVSLDEYVLNTEAHTFKRPTPGSDEIPRYYV